MMKNQSMTMSEQIKFISARNVADRYQISIATVYRWCKEHKLPQPRRLNDSTRWSVADLIEWESK